MRQRVSRRSRRLNNMALASRQWQLAAHLRHLEAQRIQATEPCRSLCLHVQGDLGYRYIIFGEEGYADPRGELPSFGFRAVWEGQGHLQGRTGGEGATTTNSQGDERSQSDDLVDSASRANFSTRSVMDTSGWLTPPDLVSGDEGGEDLSSGWDLSAHHMPVREDDSSVSSVWRPTHARQGRQ
jgi:hypothetical protein